MTIGNRHGLPSRGGGPCLALATAMLLLAGCGGGSGHTTATGAAAAPASPSPSAATGSVYGGVVDAARARSIAVYRRAGARSPFLRLKNPNRYGAPLVFLERSLAGAWTEVYLPVRPNGSTGWVRTSAIARSKDPFRVRVDLRSHRITVWKGATVVVHDPIGVGRALTPTPSGLYYITELLKQPDPHGVYGPYAFGLSAHSTVLNEFAGSDGQIGLHGTNFPAGVGRNVSHGCIRMSNRTITKLAKQLPLGTPVQITRS